MSGGIRQLATIADAFLVCLDPHVDSRGFFVETYRSEWFPSGSEMVQANRCDRHAGCVVGLHYHLRQTDYWYVPCGTIRVVLHDLRMGSPTEGNTWMADLGTVTGFNAGVYIPPGVAHGFASLTDSTVTYLVDAYYDPADELGVAWDDPEIAADWGISRPLLSDRDQVNPRKSAIPSHLKPYWQDRT